MFIHENVQAIVSKPTSRSLPYAHSVPDPALNSESGTRNKCDSAMPLIQQDGNAEEHISLPEGTGAVLPKPSVWSDGSSR